MATCPECDVEIEIDADDLEEMEVGDPWDCNACASHLRIVSLDPLEFDADADDDDDDEDEKKKSDEGESDTDDPDDDDDDDDAADDWDE